MRVGGSRVRSGPRVCAVPGLEGTQAVSVTEEGTVTVWRSQGGERLSLAP